MKEILLAGIVAFIATGFIFAGGYSAGYDEMEKKHNAYVAEQAALVDAKEKENARKMATATDTILLAEREYNDLRNERDRLLARLRHADSGAGSAAGATADALGTRIATLEKVVAELHRLLEECDAGWSACAKKHDAVAEAVK